MFFQPNIKFLPRSGLDLLKVWPHKSSFHTWFFQNISSKQIFVLTNSATKPLLASSIDFVCWVLLKLDIVNYKLCFFIKSWQRIYCFELSLCWENLYDTVQNITCLNITSLINLNELVQKNKQAGVWGYRISRGIKEIACGISRGWLKMKWNFQWWKRKNNVEFPGVLVSGLGISEGSNTILWNFQG